MPIVADLPFWLDWATRPANPRGVSARDINPKWFKPSGLITGLGKRDDQFAVVLVCVFSFSCLPARPSPGEAEAGDTLVTALWERI